MTQIMRLLVVLSIMMLGSITMASIDVFEFSSEENRQQYNALTKELRCPKCQNQDIADSNAPIAQDMRKEVYRLVEEGQSTETVVQFMVERFGEFVSYDPKIIPATYLLWFGPLTLVGVGLLVVLLLSSKRKRSAEANVSSLDSSSRQRLDAMLKDAQSDQSSKTGKEKK
jgi:cytochrome c-type biogenesis protein CcmH